MLGHIEVQRWTGTFSQHYALWRPDTARCKAFERYNDEQVFMYIILFISVSDNSPTLIGARPYTGTVMTMFD